MACMDLLILLECIGPCPKALHHVLPQCGSQTGRRGVRHIAARSHGTKGVGRPWAGKRERETRQRWWRGKHGSKKTASSHTAIELAHTCKVASGISPMLVSCFFAEHARLPGIVGPLLVDEPVQPPDWDSGNAREAVDRRTFGPSEAAGCWEGSEGGESDEERGDCTPAWSPVASEAAPAASARSAAIFFCLSRAGRWGGFCTLQLRSTTSSSS